MNKIKLIITILLFGNNHFIYCQTSCDSLFNRILSSEGLILRMEDENEDPSNFVEFIQFFETNQQDIKNCISKIGTIEKKRSILYLLSKIHYYKDFISEKENKSLLAGENYAFLLKETEGFKVAIDSFPIQFIYIIECNDYAKTYLLNLAEERVKNSGSELERMLNPCMKKGFTRNQKAIGERLFALKYYNDEAYDLMGKSVLRLLKLNPDFKEDDPNKRILQKLRKNYKRNSIFSIGFKAAGNLSFPGLINSFEADIFSEEENLFSTNPLRFTAGLSVKVPFWLSSKEKRKELELIDAIYSPWEIGIDLLYTVNAFNNANTLNFSTNPNFEFTNRSFTEEHERIDIPLTLNYRQKIAFTGLYVTGHIGGSLSYLLNAEIRNLLRGSTDNVGQTVNAGILENQNLDISSQRRNINFSALGGAGISYKIGQSFVNFDVRYQRFFFNMVNDEGGSRFENPTLVYLYGYQHSDYELSLLTFSIGVQYSLFNPKPIN